jgi:7-cyano-7-deazaguanine reductase
MSFMHELSKSPLGKQSLNNQEYSPSILVPISRESFVSQITASIYGEDIWTAYEFYFCDAFGKAQARVLQFSISCTSPYIVESKSLKLYLNTYYTLCFDSETLCVQQVKRDLEAVLQSDITIQILRFNELQFSGFPSSYLYLDERVARLTDPVLNVGTDCVEETLYSDCFRSICPVTSQPDFATIIIYYKGPKLNEANVLTYLMSYSNHPGFHERCIEEIYSDLMSTANFERLSVQGLFTRRGGIDINPFRSNTSAASLYQRHFRQ